MHWVDYKGVREIMKSSIEKVTSYFKLRSGDPEAEAARRSKGKGKGSGKGKGRGKAKNTAKGKDSGKIGGKGAGKGGSKGKSNFQNVYSSFPLLIYIFSMHVGPMC